MAITESAITVHVFVMRGGKELIAAKVDLYNYLPFTTLSFLVDCLPADCSGNGRCFDGTCDCDDHWKGNGCERGKSSFTMESLHME